MYFHLVQINGVPPTIPPLCVICLVWGNSPCCKTGVVALDHADNNNCKSTLHKSHDPLPPSLSLNLGNSNFPYPPTPLLGGIFVGGLVNWQVCSGLQVGCYRDPGEVNGSSCPGVSAVRRGGCLRYLSKVLTLGVYPPTLVNNQAGLVAVPPQPHQSIKQVPVNSYIPVVQVSCYVFSFGANKWGSPHNSTPVCCLLGLGQCYVIQ